MWRQQEKRDRSEFCSMSRGSKRFLFIVGRENKHSDREQPDFSPGVAQPFPCRQEDSGCSGWHGAALPV